jgi:hypothetical protein
VPHAVTGAAGRCFLDLQARLPDNPRLFRFPGSSVVERRTVNPLVGGSNPSRGANFTNF